MLLTHLNRNLAAGIATGALLFAVQSVLAADGGNVTGVVSDASGKPVAGAFVKLKNDQRPGFVPTFRVHAVLAKGWGTAGSSRHQLRSAATTSQTEHPIPNRRRALEPKSIRRHRQRGVLA